MTMGVERNIMLGSGNAYTEDAFHMEAFATTIAVLDELTANTEGGQVNDLDSDRSRSYDLLYHALCNFVRRHVLPCWEPSPKSFAALHGVKSVRLFTGDNCATYDLDADDVVMDGGWLPYLTQTMQQVASYRFTWSKHHPVEMAEMAFIENGLHAIVREALDAHRGVIQ